MITNTSSHLESSAETNNIFVFFPGALNFPTNMSKLGGSSVLVGVQDGWEKMAC
jgi:hypothetical protein